MKDLFKLILGVLASLFKSRAGLEAEILILRQQINVLRRRAPKRPHLNNTDDFLFVWLYHWYPAVLGAIAIVRPKTIIRWNHAEFRAYWRRRSRNPVGRPKVSAELRTLIGSIRRECLDHMIVFGEAHLRRILGVYAAYYPTIMRRGRIVP
jgi:hypothetical protein